MAAGHPPKAPAAAVKRGHSDTQTSAATAKPAKSPRHGSEKTKVTAAAQSFESHAEASVVVDIAVCPICSKQLLDMAADKVEFHVNCCLDAAVLEAKKQKKVRPATAHQSKHKPPPKSMDPPLLADSLPKCSSSEIPIDDLLNEIEQAPLCPESKPKGAYTHVYEYHKPESPTEATETTASQRKRTPRGQPKPLPSYKRMPGTTFTVDAFKYGALDFCTAYFLTHFHSDHYGGLTKGFAGEIYCSRITANLVISKFRIDPRQVHALPMNTRCIVQGVYVTLIDARHCPGAAIILFEVPEGGKLMRIVHTGDFRAADRHVQEIMCVFRTHINKPVTPGMLLSPQGAVSKEAEVLNAVHTSPMVDYIYLDTTYLEPTYSFPKQHQVVDVVGEFCYRIDSDSEYLPAALNRLRNNSKAEKQTPHLEAQQQQKSSLITRWFQPVQRVLSLKAETKPATLQPISRPANRRRVLFVVGTYTIGKEKLFIEIARRLRSKIYVPQDKRRLLDCFQSTSLSNMLTDAMDEAQVHAVPMSMVNMRGMAEYLHTVQAAAPSFTRVVAFSPTGWSHAGPYIPGRQHTPSPIRPHGVPVADIDRVAQGERYHHDLSALLAESAHMSDDSGESFGVEKLKPRGLSDRVAIFPVPYSEHSSFAELARFVCSLKAGQVLPTVYSTSDKNRQANDWLCHWHELKLAFEQKISGSSLPVGTADEHAVFG